MIHWLYFATAFNIMCCVLMAIGMHHYFDSLGWMISAVLFIGNLCCAMNNIVKIIKQEFKV